MSNPYFNILCWCCLFLLGTRLQAQDEEKPSLVDKAKDQVKVSGSLGYTNTYFATTDTNSKRAPFFWQVQANLNIKIGIVNMPFSARFNSQGGDASYPTVPSQIGMSPKYKDWTFHLGWRSMQFSEFSLAGNQFVGIGVEHNPKNFWISSKVMFGRFQKAYIAFDQNNVILGIPAYERFGYGAQMTLGKGKHKVGLHAFRAKDDPASLGANSLLTPETPQENLVYGLTTEQQLTDKISVDGEITWSALTSDNSLEESVYEGYSYLNNVGGLFAVNASTQLKKAIRANLSYSPEKYQLKFTYRRIDPQYRSLGALFLNNDLEDITANLGFGLLQKKISIALSGGLQRNNIEQDKVSQTLRLIGATDVTYTPNEKWTFNANYSNFTTNTSMTLARVAVDTLAYVQVTSALGGSVMRNIAGEKVKHTVMLMGNTQQAVAQGNRESQTLLAVLSETMTFIQPKINVTVAITTTQTNTEAMQMTMIGPTLAASKPFWEGKITTTAAVAYMSSSTNGVNQGSIINSKLGMNYKIAQHHAANASIGLNQKRLAVTNSELLASAGYMFTF